MKDMENISKEKEQTIIVEKYLIRNQSEYFDIIKELEWKNILYYVYA